MAYAKVICEKLGLNPEIQLKKKIRGLKGFSTIELVEALIKNETVSEAAKYLGYTDNPIKQTIRQTLSPLFPYRSQEFGVGGKVRSWRLELLQAIEYSYCTSCNSILPIQNFGVNTSISSTSGINSKCKCCRNHELSLRKEYIKDRTPNWADLDTIAIFYKNCPKGHHVDHIIPLHGSLVSGLHVINNLQYLPAVENIRKNNTYNIE